MLTETEAIVCALRSHGEHGGIVRMMTPRDGLVAAYVRGARGRRMRPVLIPGNAVAAQLRSRSELQLPQATLELVHSRAGLLGEPLPAAAVEWVTALTATVLPERQPYPRLYEAMGGFLDALEAAPTARGWAGALVAFETLVISQLGYEAGNATVPAGQDWDQVFTSLQRTGRQLSRDVLPERARSLADIRIRLVERLKRLAD